MFLIKIKLNATNATKVPVTVATCVDYLRAQHCEQVDGIFRISGDAGEIAALSKRFQDGEAVNLDKMPNLNIHTVSSILKRWFRELDGIDFVFLFI